jgi:hypothetical protein
LKCIAEEIKLEGRENKVRIMGLKAGQEGKS